MSNQKIVLVLLRISIASVFLYAAISSLITPDNWIGFFPKLLRDTFPTRPLLLFFSAYEIGLSLWILSGWKNFYAAILSALTLLGIIGSNLNQLDIVFRDFAIFFSSLALAVGTYKKK